MSTVILENQRDTSKITRHLSQKWSLVVSLSRREFMQWLTTSMAAIGGEILLPSLHAQDNPQTIPAPPTLMFHSRHRWLLPEIVNWLVADGFTGITYLDLDKVLRGEITLPEKPIMITIDDMALDKGNPNFETFVAMHDTLVQAHFAGVFGVITRPDWQQSDERWAQVATWTQQHIELATHTAHHQVLDNPRWTDADYDIEIMASAHMIAERSGQPVKTLITPYGSGYDQQQNELNPAVMAACQRAGIRFVVGIVEGRQPLALNPADDAVLYLGRTVPGPDDTLSGAQTGIANWLYWSGEQLRH
jgi:peptidoglycan/xylan/chitin deacetylase (PgdA/CDA1 family)